MVGGTGNLPADGNRQARLSKNDFSTDGEVHVFVNGKTANGLSYGAVIEMAFNQQEGRNIVQTRASTGKTTANIDEWYAFVASPTWGQIRFGDEDGPVGGLMNSGVITNFGTGGVYGDRESFVTRQADDRTTTSPGCLGDNTKIIYLSPQFFGFDFGASFAFNYNEGEDTGCSNNQSSGFCDSSYAFTGAVRLRHRRRRSELSRPAVTNTRGRPVGAAAWPASACPSPVAMSAPARPAS